MSAAGLAITDKHKRWPGLARIANNHAPLLAGRRKQPG